MKKTRKCQLCKVDDTHKDLMAVEYVGKNQAAKYYHKECHTKFLKDKEFKEKEKQELDVLVEMIKKIYGVKKLPNQVYPFIQAIRNGEDDFGRKDKLLKRYKRGYSYSLISQTFDYCSDSIEYACREKEFNGFMAAFRYGLAIVLDKISVVEKMNEKKETLQHISERRMENVEGFEVTHKSTSTKREKQKDDLDISAFL